MAPVEPTGSIASATPPLSQSQIRAAYAKPQGRDEQALVKTAKDFEAVFLNQLLSAMDATIDRSDSMMSGGSAEETFRGMMNQEISASIANHPGGSGVGLAESIFSQAYRYLHAPKATSTVETTTTTPATGLNPGVTP